MRYRLNVHRLPQEEPMELVCEKYKEKVDSDEPVCRHPDDYCQTRISCIIQYMEKERKREQQKRLSPARGLRNPVTDELVKSPNVFKDG